jgi:hypothetical protein
MKKRNLISGGDGHTDDENTVIRRTITVDDFVNTAINSLRAKALTDGQFPDEIDFTSAINMFAEIGIWHAWDSTTGLSRMTDQENAVLRKYLLGSEDLKLAGKLDQWQDAFLKKNLQKFIQFIATESQKQAPSPKGVSA